MDDEFALQGSSMTEGEKDESPKNKNKVEITSFKLIVKFLTRFSLRKNLFTLSSGQLKL